MRCYGEQSGKIYEGDRNRYPVGITAAHALLAGALRAAIYPRDLRPRSSPVGSKAPKLFSELLLAASNILQLS